MVRFGEYLENNIDEEWREYYINYKELKDLIDNIISYKPNSEKIFCKKLDNEWMKIYNFINLTISSICDKDLTSTDVLELLRINTFVHINREGFRKIIKKHIKQLRNGLMHNTTTNKRNKRNYSIGHGEQLLRDFKNILLRKKMLRKLPSPLD